MINSDNFSSTGIDRLRERAKNDALSAAIGDLFVDDKYGTVPLVQPGFLQPLMDSPLDVEGVGITFWEAAPGRINIGAGILQPEGEDAGRFLDDSLALIDELVPRQQFAVDLVGLTTDYVRRDIKSMGAIALFSGEAGRFMALMVPSALVTDPTLPYAQVASRELKNVDDGDVEVASTAFTAGFVDYLFRHTSQ